MIDLYYWPTPNGWKITIFLEESGTPYRIVPVNIGKGEQCAPAFLKISPLARVAPSCSEGSRVAAASAASES